MYEDLSMGLDVLLKIGWGIVWGDVIHSGTPN